MLIVAYEINCSTLIKFFIKNLCYNNINKNIIADYIAIFQYVSKLFIFEIYQFRKIYLNWKSRILFNSINAFLQNIIIDISVIISKDIREHIIIYSTVII